MERSSNKSAAPVEETKRKMFKKLLSFIKHLEKFTESDNAQEYNACGIKAKRINIHRKYAIRSSLQNV
jgi:hypothetical protein